MNVSLTLLPMLLFGLLELVLWGLSGMLWVEVWAAQPFQGVVVSDIPTLKTPRIAVLIPAHNEAADIEGTVRSLQSDLASEDRLVVVADNCEDATATVAQQAGATVLERHDLVQRGKGYALDYGLQVLSQTSPPDVIIFMDADCTIVPGSLKILAQQAWSTQRPIQSTYLMHSPLEATFRDQLSAFAITLKNLVRPLGMRTLGWPCLLTGSGMAIPWALLKPPISLAGNRNADDMQLTVDLALQGKTPLYEPRSQVMGRLMRAEDAHSQRTRWEHGHLRMILTQVPRLLGAGFTQGRWDLLFLALEMAIPPLSLFVLLWFGSVLLTVGAMSLGFGSWGSVGFSLIPGGLIALSVGRAWQQFGRDLLPIQSWAEIPRYLFWKAPIYLQFVTRPQTRWLRTERDHKS